MTRALRVAIMVLGAFCACSPPCGGAEGPGRFTFAVIGDHRDGLTVYEGIIGKVLEVHPAFALHTGDFVWSGADAEEWAAFREASKPLLEHPPAPGLTAYLYPTIGNHEFFPDMQREHLSNYFETFTTIPPGTLYYSFDYCNSHFVSLFFPEESDIVPTAEELAAMLAWLESDLRAADENPAVKWKFVFFHASMFSSTSVHGCSGLLHEALMPILNAHNVEAVFNGHTHAYQRYGPLKFYDEDPEGVTYIVSAGCGSTLYPQDRQDDANLAACDAWTGTHHVVRAAHVESKYHYVIMEVTDTCVSGTAYRNDGAILDTFLVRGQLPFARGDLNADRRRDIADAMCVLGYLFNARDEACRAFAFRCPDAADANDDGRVNIADALKVLAHLFTSAGPLPEPMACGLDPTPDDLSCTSFPPCVGP